MPSDRDLRPARASGLRSDVPRPLPAGRDERRTTTGRPTGGAMTERPDSPLLDACKSRWCPSATRARATCWTRSTATRRGAIRCSPCGPTTGSCAASLDGWPRSSPCSVSRSHAHPCSSWTRTPGGPENAAAPRSSRRSHLCPRSSGTSGSSRRRSAAPPAFRRRRGPGPAPAADRCRG